MRLYYVVKDEEGLWITESVSEGDKALFVTTKLSAAEQALCYLINREDQSCE